MDVSLIQSIVNTSTSLAGAKNANSVNITVLKQAIDLQASTAATMIEALPQPALATSGTLGTLVNTFA